MPSKRTFIAELFARRIPPIIGMYIGAMWLLMELSDWAMDKFNLSVQLSTYIFLAMLMVLPSVVLFSWGHGRPGKDKWTGLEKIVLPMNLVLTIILLTIFNLPKNNATTIQVTQTHVTNQFLTNPKQSKLFSEEAKMSVSKKPNTVSSQHQSIIVYFWENKNQESSLDWISYAIGWLMAQDLQRTQYITVDTVYSSKKLYRRLLDKGFVNALNVPLALELQIASNESVNWIATGVFEFVDGNYVISADLYDVQSGKSIKTIRVKEKNWIVALDSISDTFEEMILKKSNIAIDSIQQLAINEHTSKNIDAIKLLIQSLNAVTFNNDFNEGINKIQNSIKKDEYFAQANLLLAGMYLSTGDRPNTLIQLGKALDLDYKLYSETIYLLKSKQFALTGYAKKTTQILQNWVKDYPKSIDALENLAQNHIDNLNLPAAIDVYEKIVLIDGTTHKSLINLAKIYRLQNNKDKALTLLKSYLEDNPTRSHAYFEMADAYIQFGLLSDAKTMYEEASLYDNKDFKAEIGIANIEALEGDYLSSIFQFQLLFEKSETDYQRFEILSHLQNLLIKTGQIRHAIIKNEEMTIYGSTVLPPFEAATKLQGEKIKLLAMLGENEKATQVAKVLKTKLKAPLNEYVDILLKPVSEKNRNLDRLRNSIVSYEKFINNLNFFKLKADMFSAKALLSFWQEDYKEALSLYDKSLSESSQSLQSLDEIDKINDTLYKKAEVYTAKGRYEDALLILNQTLVRMPIFAKANCLKAEIYLKQNKIKQARKQINIAKKIWRKADKDYINYKYLLELEATHLSPIS